MIVKKGQKLILFQNMLLMRLVTQQSDNMSQEQLTKSCKQKKTTLKILNFSKLKLREIFKRDLLLY